MTNDTSHSLELLLDLLLEAAAPLPFGATDAPGKSAAAQLRDSQASFGPTPRELLISFQQVIARLCSVASAVCGADSAAVVSFNGEVFHLHTSTTLPEALAKPLSDPLLGSTQEPTTSSLETLWTMERGAASRTLLIDAYGEIKVYLLLGWSSPDIDPDQQAMADLLQRVANGALRFQRKAASSRRRARWVSSSRHLTEALLAGADEEEALNLVATAAQSGAGADAALIFLPSVGDQWACEIASGDGAQAFIGMPFPRGGVFKSALENGHGIILRSMVHNDLGGHPAFAQYGPIVLTPMHNAATPDGALMLLRREGREPFAPDDLPLTEAFASQTSLALEVASARHSQSLALLLEDRARISRDLHDFAVQQLFATGMKLDFLREGAQAGTLSQRRMTEGLQEAMASLEESVLQIRSIVHDLKETDLHMGFTERMERESSRARHFLGFAPSLIFELDGVIINPGAPEAEGRLEDMSSRVDDEIGDDAAAIVREALSNIARHAHARATRVEISASGHGQVGELVISAIDDGRGIDPSQTRSSGLANMSKRARMHGGSFAVGAGPRGRGTSLVWRVPLAQ